MEALMGPCAPAAAHRGEAERAARFPADLYLPISCDDVTELSRALRENWEVDVTQLRAGDFSANGGIVALDCALVAQITYSQPLLHRTYAPRGSVAVLIPGRGSDEAFLGGRQLESTQCVVVADGGCVDAITRGRYVDISIAIDQDVWNAQSHWLNECSLATMRGTGARDPGSPWINRMRDTVKWIFAAIEKNSDALARSDVRASLRDQFLAVVTDFGCSTDESKHHTRDARVQQRLAVERAREYIRTKLSEPLRLSELCSYAHVRARSLEYGFREITGLSPIAYVKSLRLNAVRKTLLRGERERSISEIALDQGFWHLSQFAVDYRKFFGETPTSTRRRALAMGPAS